MFQWHMRKDLPSLRCIESPYVAVHWRSSTSRSRTPSVSEVNPAYMALTREQVAARRPKRTRRSGQSNQKKGLRDEVQGAALDLQSTVWSSATISCRAPTQGPLTQATPTTHFCFRNFIYLLKHKKPLFLALPQIHVQTR